MNFWASLKFFFWASKKMVWRWKCSCSIRFPSASEEVSKNKKVGHIHILGFEWITVSQIKICITLRILLASYHARPDSPSFRLFYRTATCGLAAQNPPQNSALKSFFCGTYFIPYNGRSSAYLSLFFPLSKGIKLLLVGLVNTLMREANSELCRHTATWWCSLKRPLLLFQPVYAKTDSVSMVNWWWPGYHVRGQIAFSLLLK